MPRPRILVGFSVCVACIALAGVMYNTMLDRPLYLQQSSLFLGDEEHLMREMALSWRDKEMLRSDEGQGGFPSQSLRGTGKDQILTQIQGPAKFSMLASPSKPQNKHKSAKESKQSSHEILAVKSKITVSNSKADVLSIKRKTSKPESGSATALSHTAQQATSASEKAESNSLVKFAGDLAQEIVRR